MSKTSKSTWQFSFERRTGRRSWAIYDALRRDIGTGALMAGEKLPTVRGLADTLGITANTVAKAYKAAEREGLIVSRVGYGTFVRDFPEALAVRDNTPSSVIDLTEDGVGLEPFNPHIRKIFGQLSRRGVNRLFDYYPSPGPERHRAAAARWIGRRRIQATADRILLGHNQFEALTNLLMVLVPRGKVVLTEGPTSPILHNLARSRVIDIRGVASDAQGLIPEALRAAGRDGAAGAILCSPTIQDPTNTVMPIERRQAVCEIAAEMNVIIVENDSAGHLSGDQTPTLAEMAPERVIHVSDVSKSIAGAFGVCFILSPPSLVEQLVGGDHEFSSGVNVFLNEVVTMMIEDGTADEILAWRKAECAARQDLAVEILDGQAEQPEGYSYHHWLPLPEPRCASTFVENLRNRGVLVRQADSFAVGTQPMPQAISLCLWGPRDRAKLRDALMIVADLLKEGTGASRPVVRAVS